MCLGGSDTASASRQSLPNSSILFTESYTVMICVLNILGSFFRHRHLLEKPRMPRFYESVGEIFEYLKDFFSLYFHFSLFPICPLPVF